MIKNFSLLILLLCLTVSGFAKSTWKDRNDWEKYFNDAKVEGCFPLYNLQKKEYYSYNRRRVETPFIPASTFKFFNSLGALEMGAVKDENEVLKWDSVNRRFPQWNKDHDMKTAFQNSTVWFYQEMARRIGAKRMRHYLNKAHYGNRNNGGGIDQFWLTGNLRTTAKQQIDFLVKLHRSELPFSARTINIVKNFSIVEKTDEYILRAKSGWAFDLPSPQIGWWVGYVERGGKAYFFALNLDVKRDEDLTARAAITKSILREMKIIEP